MQERSYRSRFILISQLFALLAITALVFWPGLSGGFIFDDYPIFAENPAVHVSGWHWQAWQSLWDWSNSNTQRPLAMFSYALNYALGGSTWGFKTLNLAIHLLNTLLVWLLVRRLLAAAWLKTQTDFMRVESPDTDIWASGIALAWAIHPLQVSTVMYVVQRMELLGFTFTLLALLAYWQARQRQQTGQLAWPWLLLSGIAILTGYCFKQTAVLAPGYAFLLELTVLRFRASRPSTCRAWKILYAAGCVATLVIFVGYLLPHYATAEAYAKRDYSAWQRELTQLRVLSMYLAWCILPLPSQLHFYYDNYAASAGWLDPSTTLLSGLLLLGLAGLAVAVRSRRPLIALGIGWFFVAHALTSSPIPLELVFEHRNYPALLGIVIAATDLLWLATRQRPPRLAATIACVLLLNLGFLTTLRAATWGNPVQLAMTLAQDNPCSPRAALDLARRFVELSNDNPNSPIYSLAIDELERGAKLPNASPLLENALIIQAANHSGLDSTPWWSSLDHKLQFSPLGPEAYLALHGLLQARLVHGINIDAKQLALAYQIALSRNPNRVSLHLEYAELAQGPLADRPLATAEWKKAVILQKDVPNYASGLAGYLIQNHLDREAVEVIDEALSIHPPLVDTPTLLNLRSQAELATKRQNEPSGT
ncbi:hypothetical protein [Dyella mobilis]|uniref:Tetratricopeptide repeat protein n=1 Tax=Dyella mobilis TaxID=1849582 RepID=A0ABS2KGL6_9GAMM|nr:hypothetical protein [Dyella mobilis]MBM7130063.1 hypothetical protein [Dyella mobilis]GLQ96688.1 hypothetical protein GCM10007863_11080 [Dyella mobilis]